MSLNVMSKADKVSIFVKSQSQMFWGSPEMHPWYYFEDKQIKTSDREKLTNESALFLITLLKSSFETIWTVLMFCCLISWNFLMLYRFNLKSQNVFMIGGQLLFITLNTSVVKVWLFLWWIMALLTRCISSWNGILVSL